MSWYNVWLVGFVITVLAGEWRRDPIEDVTEMIFVIIFTILWPITWVVWACLWLGYWSRKIKAVRHHYEHMEAQK